jgi:hypothetical protein
LQKVKDLKRNWDELHPDGIPEQFIGDVLYDALYDKIDKQNVIWYVVRRLSEPFIWSEYGYGRKMRHTLMMDENRKFRTNGIKKARRFLTAVSIPLNGFLIYRFIR